VNIGTLDWAPQTVKSVCFGGILFRHSRSASMEGRLARFYCVTFASNRLSTCDMYSQWAPMSPLNSQVASDLGTACRHHV